MFFIYVLVKKKTLNRELLSQLNPYFIAVSCFLSTIVNKMRDALAIKKIIHAWESFSQRKIDLYIIYRPIYIEQN